MGGPGHGRSDFLASGHVDPKIFRSTVKRPSAKANARRSWQHFRADHQVLSTGGGAVVDEALWSDDRLRRSDTLVVALDSEPVTILDRLRREALQAGEAVERPMLAGSDFAFAHHAA